MLYVDPTTKTLLDPDSAIHPFSMASKIKSEDYPSFKEIMHMSPKEQAKWLDLWMKKFKLYSKPALVSSRTVQMSSRNKKKLLSPHRRFARNGNHRVKSHATRVNSVFAASPKGNWYL